MTDKYTRYDLATLIHDRLNRDKELLSKSWKDSTNHVEHFYLDDLLPEHIVFKIYKAFPRDTSKMLLRKTIRELKYVAAQMNQYDDILEEIVFAFQDERIVRIVADITKLKGLEPDSLLYAGGISMMAQNHFLNPHLDNSHDKERARYRVANLLFYVSPDWVMANGGNLELWPDCIKHEQLTIESRFNRLVVMVTNDKSWHSVSKVQVDKVRCCISNYYFSKYPANVNDYFHVTSFRGRPEETLRDLVLVADNCLRMFIRKVFPKGVFKIKHYYNKRK
jgi:Rps23 Pro-64 3,4-dihydroxylase Tpa1-like proline 4-hydroxylase